MYNKVAQTKAIRELYEKYSFDFIDGVFVVKATLSNNIIELLDNNAIEFSLRYEDKNVRRHLYRQKIGKEVEISIEKDTLTCENNIYNTWESFLEFKANLFVCPDLFWIVSDDFFFNKKENITNSSTVFKHYLDACSLIELLIKVSDYQDKYNEDVVDSVIFLTKSKLEIYTSYKLSDLDKGLDGITIVSSMLNEELHLEHKNSIFKEVLYSLLGDVTEKNRLKYLFEHFGEFSTRLSDNYQLFVSEFSFDSVRSEYEEKKRDYIIKLNDALASVQTKMLGIPVSLGFLSLKYESSNISDTVSSHIALSIGIVIYCIMMFLLIANQFHTIKAVKDEYSSLMKRLKYKHASQHNKISVMIKNLDDRYVFQQRTLFFYIIVTSVLLIASLSF